MSSDRIRRAIGGGHCTGHISADDLLRLSLFARVPLSELEQLCRLATWQSYGRRQEIGEVGEDQGWVYLIASGRVTVCGYAELGRELTLLTLEADMLIDLAVADVGPPCSICARAASDETIIYRFVKELFRGVAQSHAEMSALLVKQVQYHAAELAHHLLELVSYDATARLAHTLAREAPRSGTEPLTFTQTELAAMIGVSREEVSRSLRKLRSRGLIGRDSQRRGIRVLDVEGLRNTGTVVHLIS